MLRALLVTFLCACAAGCASGWPAVKHNSTTTAHAAPSCQTSASRIVHTDCSTVTPTSKMSGEELDEERHMHGNGAPVGGVIAPF